MSEAPSALAFTCTESACQIAAGGACLEGFPSPEGCPHAIANLNAVDDGIEGDAEDALLADDPGRDQETEDVEGGPQGDSELVAVPGDEALTLAEVGELIARHPVNMVLIAGEAAVGKTTLVAELFARFLSGRFGPWSFGGSETLRAFHIRLHPSLAESGAGEPTTERTAEEDMRFLHLCLSRDGQRHHIVASDGKGEYFENLIDGSTVAAEIPIAGRVDRCVLAIDGDRLDDPMLRDSSLSRARLLLRALRGPNGLPRTCPVAIVCTKWDRVTAQNREVVLDRVKKLAASQEGDVAVLTASVRPGPPKAEVDGLSELLDFIAPPMAPESARTQAVEPGPSVSVEQGRHFWRGPMTATEVNSE